MPEPIELVLWLGVTTENTVTLYWKWILRPPEKLGVGLNFRIMPPTFCVSVQKRLYGSDIFWNTWSRVVSRNIVLTAGVRSSDRINDVLKRKLCYFATVGGLSTCWALVNYRITYTFCIL